MKTVLKAMQRQKDIPLDITKKFEKIIEKWEKEFGQNLKGITCFKPEWNDEFSTALTRYLNEEQRYRLYEEAGACQGAGDDKKRRAFAQEHKVLPLAARLELFEKTFDRAKAVLNKDDNTITVKFACNHGYYRQARLAKGMYKVPENVKGYFERCAGGRLYEYQKALGIKLKIKSVDVSPLYDNTLNPVMFTFQIL